MPTVQQNNSYKAVQMARKHQSDGRVVFLIRMSDEDVDISWVIQEVENDGWRLDKVDWVVYPQHHVDMADWPYHHSNRWHTAGFFLFRR